MEKKLLLALQLPESKQNTKTNKRITDFLTASSTQIRETLDWIFIDLTQALAEEFQSWGGPCCRSFDNTTSTIKIACYHCKACALAANSLLCKECFEASDHRNHHSNGESFEVILESGTCDCGNQTMWKKSGSCPRHIRPEIHQQIDVFQRMEQIQENNVRTKVREIGLYFIEVFLILIKNNQKKKADIFIAKLFEDIHSMCKKRKHAYKAVFDLMMAKIVVNQKERIVCQVLLQYPFLQQMVKSYQNLLLLLMSDFPLLSEKLLPHYCYLYLSLKGFSDAYFFLGVNFFSNSMTYSSILQKTGSLNKVLFFYEPTGLAKEINAKSEQYYDLWEYLLLLRGQIRKSYWEAYISQGILKSAPYSNAFSKEDSKLVLTHYYGLERLYLKQMTKILSIVDEKGIKIGLQSLSLKLRDGLSPYLFRSYQRAWTLFALKFANIQKQPSEPFQWSSETIQLLIKTTKIGQKEKYFKKAVKVLLLYWGKMLQIQSNVKEYDSCRREYFENKFLYLSDAIFLKIALRILQPSSIGQIFKQISFTLLNDAQKKQKNSMKMLAICEFASEAICSPVSSLYFSHELGFGYSLKQQRQCKQLFDNLLASLKNTNITFQEFKKQVLFLFFDPVTVLALIKQQFHGQIEGTALKLQQFRSLRWQLKRSDANIKFIEGSHSLFNLQTNLLLQLNIPQVLTECLIKNAHQFRDKQSATQICKFLLQLNYKSFNMGLNNLLVNTFTNNPGIIDLLSSEIMSEFNHYVPNQDFIPEQFEYLTHQYQHLNNQIPEHNKSQKLKENQMEKVKKSNTKCARCYQIINKNGYQLCYIRKGGFIDTISLQNPSNIVLPTSCGHYLHEECIISLPAVCPLCKRPANSLFSQKQLLAQEEIIYLQRILGIEYQNELYGELLRGVLVIILRCVDSSSLYDMSIARNIYHKIIGALDLKLQQFLKQYPLLLKEQSEVKLLSQQLDELLQNDFSKQIPDIMSNDKRSQRLLHLCKYLHKKLPLPAQKRLNHHLSHSLSKLPRNLAKLPQYAAACARCQRNSQAICFFFPYTLSSCFNCLQTSLMLCLPERSICGFLRLDSGTLLACFRSQNILRISEKGGRLYEDSLLRPYEIGDHQSKKEFELSERAVQEALFELWRWGEAAWRQQFNNI